MIKVGELEKPYTIVKIFCIDGLQPDFRPNVEK